MGTTGPHSRPTPIRPDSPWPRRWRRCRIAVFVGAGLTVLGTMLPWAEGVYWGSPFGWTGWELHYLHGPKFIAAVPPLIFALAAAGAAAAAIRRPPTVRLALGPGMLIMGWVAFTYQTYAVGPFGAFIRQFPGYSSRFLGPGFWLMAAGGLLMAVAAFVADMASPDVILWRSATWLITAMFEFSLLYISPATFAPALLLGVLIIGLFLWTRSVIRRRSHSGPPAIAGPIGSPDAERIDMEPADRLHASAGTE